MRKVILVDANHLLSRTFHVPAFQSLNVDIDGEEVFTGATFGFLQSLKRMIELHKQVNDMIIVVWDGSGPGFRSILSSDYKANRAKKTPDFLCQMKLTKEFLKCMGVLQCELANTEADDVIATLAKRARLKNFKVLIISGDKDFNQIVSTHINVLNPKGHNEYILMTPDTVQEHYGVTPRLFVDYLSLLGDSSDNVSGIESVGKKTAAELVCANGTVEDILASDIHYKLKDGVKKPISKSLQEKINSSKDVLRLAKQLVTIKLDIDVSVDDVKPDFHLLKNMFKKYNFKSFLDDFSQFVTLFS